MVMEQGLGDIRTCGQCLHTCAIKATLREFLFSGGKNFDQSLIFRLCMGNFRGTVSIIHKRKCY